MKLIIQKDILNEAIQHVAKAVSSRTTIQILTGIKIDVSEQGILLTGSDTDISIQSFIPIEANEETLIQLEQTGSVVVPGKLFIEIIRKLPAKDVTIEVTSNYHITIKSGRSELQMIGLDPEEYPLLPALDEHNPYPIQSDQLKTMIRQTIFAVSTNENTPVLTGVLCNLMNQRLKFIGTDRHRLSTSEAMLDIDPDFELNNLIIAGKNLAELQRLLPDENIPIFITAADNMVKFNVGNISFFTRILEGSYPDTSKIIPQNFVTELTLNTKQLTDAMERAYLLSREEKTNIVRLSITDDSLVEISSSLSELGKITEQVELENLAGDGIKISFNSRYMLDALKSVESEKIQIGFTGTMSPFVLKPVDNPHLLHLILPYRTAN